MAYSLLTCALVLFSPWRFAESKSHSKALRGSLSSQHVLHQQGQQGFSRRVAGRSSQPELLEEWEDSNKALQSILSDKDLMDLGAVITAETYGKQLHEFVDSFESRFVDSPDNEDASDYISKKFKEMGLNVSHQVVKMASRGIPTHTNVIAYLQGTDLPQEVVLLGAHYDSVNWEDTKKSAPGVDDNGSGVALLLTIARILSGAKHKPRRSIMFVAFNAEELGLVGSEHFAKMFEQGGHGPDEYGDLKAVFIADEVAWPGKGSERRKAIFETSGRASETTCMVDTLARLALLKNSSSSIAGDGIGDGAHNFVVNYHGFGSDHMSFLDRGIPAVLLIERDDTYHSDVWGHSARDTFEHVDMSFGAAMSRLALRAVASFANPV